MHEIGRRLGAGIGTLINVFDPEVVVLGGGFSSALDLLLDSAREVVAQEALPPGRTSARIVPAELGGDAGMIGAGARRVRSAGAVVPLAVCATPIGNLEDVTLRVLRELAEADLVLCEDTRRTRILLDRHGIEARLLSYHEHNEAERTAQVLPRLEAGERIALTSDAGLPGVNDPGARLISAALEAGVPVTVLPGPRRSRRRSSRAVSSASATSSSATCRAARGARGALGGARALAVAGRGVRVAAPAARDPRARWPRRCRSGRSRSAAS